MFLNRAGGVGPVVYAMAPAANDSTLWVSWSWLGSKHKFTFEGELLYYVTECMSVPAAGLQWQKLTKDLQNTSITGTPTIRKKHICETASQSSSTQVKQRPLLVIW